MHTRYKLAYAIASCVIYNNMYTYTYVCSPGRGVWVRLLWFHEILSELSLSLSFSLSTSPPAPRTIPCGGLHYKKVLCVHSGEPRGRDALPTYRLSESETKSIFSYINIWIYTRARVRDAERTALSPQRTWNESAKGFLAKHVRIAKGAFNSFYIYPIYYYHIYMNVYIVMHAMNMLKNVGARERSK